MICNGDGTIKYYFITLENVHKILMSFKQTTFINKLNEFIKLSRLDRVCLIKHFIQSTRNPRLFIWKCLWLVGCIQFIWVEIYTHGMCVCTANMYVLSVLCAYLVDVLIVNLMANSAQWSCFIISESRIDEYIFSSFLTGYDSNSLR